jgi:acetone carboxylase gamma subunit
MTGKDAKRQISESCAFLMIATEHWNYQRMEHVRKVNEIREACPHENLSVDAGSYVHDVFCSDCGGLVRRHGEF